MTAENTAPARRSAPNLGRLAGCLWLLCTVAGGFGMFYLRSRVIVPSDAAASAAHLTASEFAYRAAIVGNLLAQVFLFFTGLTLFELFRTVDRKLATLLLCSVALTVGIGAVNALNFFGALLLLGPVDYLQAFNAEQRQAMAMTLLRLGNSSGQGLVEIFWTPFFCSFGLLAIKSRFLPKLLGVLLIVMSAGYALNLLTKFLVPQFHPALFTNLAMALGALGDFPRCCGSWCGARRVNQ